ncbi:MAG: MIP/aquaporin family protein [Candidatus Hydrothermarchaeales archaeon]
MDKRYLAEAVGTFCLVFAGTGAMIVDSVTGKLGLLGISVVFGVVVGVMVYSLARISGAHINPAVTLGLASVKRFPKKEVPYYVFFQLVGASLASLFLFVIFGDLGRKSYFGATLVNPVFGWQIAFAMEVVMTFFLMFAIMGTTTREDIPYSVWGVAIGGTVSLDVFLGGPISGASMNPARTFGPSIVSGNFAFHWLYWLAPILGAVIAALLYEYIKA